MDFGDFLKGAGKVARATGGFLKNCAIADAEKRAKEYEHCLRTNSYKGRQLTESQRDYAENQIEVLRDRATRLKFGK